MCDCGGNVWQSANARRERAPLRRQPRNRIRAGLKYLIVSERRAWWRDLVACTENRYARALHNLHTRGTCCSGQRQRDRIELATCFQHNLVRGEINAYASDMPAQQHSTRMKLISLDARVFMDEHRVCANGDWRAGRYPHRLSRAQGARERMSRR